MDMGGIPSRGGVNPPNTRVVTEAGVDHPIHVASWGDTEVAGVDNPSPDPQEEHGN